MMIYKDSQAAFAAAEARMRSERESFVIYRGPNTDHIVIPRSHSNQWQWWPGGKDCWAYVATVLQRPIG